VHGVLDQLSACAVSLRDTMCVSASACQLSFCITLLSLTEYVPLKFAP